MTTTFVVDPSTRLIDGGKIVVGGSPLRMFRLSEAGTRVARALVAGAPLPGGHRALTDRLLAAGAIHPDPAPGTGPGPSSVSLIIPAHRVDARVLRALVDAARAEGVAEVIVVDDASEPPIDPIHGATLFRLPTNQGPGAARNRGAQLGHGSVLAFVDADTTPRPGWLQPLLDHLGDPRVGLVAPRITARPRGAPLFGDPCAPAAFGSPKRSGRLARFERWRSPLDLGPLQGRIRAGSRLSYVPAAALVVRRAAFEAIGGFDESLRFGEDVDAVWRLDQLGWGCRYVPAAQVIHETRPTLGGWLRQRFDYGTSAEPLAARHLGALAPARVSVWSALAWGIGALGSPTAGLTIGMASTFALVAKLRPMEHPYLEAARLAGQGNLFAGRIIAAAITRAWWPIGVVAALFSRRARRVVLAAALVPAAIEWFGDRPSIDLPTAVGLHLLDDLAYGAGVWAGVLRTGRLDPLVPDLRNWPGRDSASG